MAKKAHARGAMPLSQPEAHPSMENADVPPLTMPPGIFPMEGRLSIERWAEVWGNTPLTIRRWVMKYRIPHKSGGEGMMIDANDFWAALPSTFDEPDVSQKKGA